jgi:hypothetical protein
MTRAQPLWQPIEALPLIAGLIDGYLPESQDMLRMLAEARGRPYELDDATLDRVVRVYSVQQNDLGLFEDQLRRWSRGPLTAEQGREIRRLTEVLTRTKAQLADILALAGELRKDTIDRVLTKSDLELGLEALRRHSKPEP